jgi:ABC-type nitrate/sulfonate/bicarbonate transport system substrate-binding protein
MPGYHLPYFTAAANKIYEKHGLSVEIVYPEPGIDNIRAVASRRYDLCLTSVAHYLNAKKSDRTLPAKFVFMIARQTHMAVFFVPNRATASGRAIGSFSDLDGSSYVGPSDSAFTREYQSLFEQLDLTMSAFNDVPYEEVESALAAGKGDVAADYLDLLPRFEKTAHPYGVEIAALPFYQAGIDIYGSGLVAGERLIETRSGAIRSLVAAITEALVATRNDPGLGVAALCDRFPEVDPDRAVRGWVSGEPLIFVDGSEDEIGKMEAAKWNKTLQHHARVHGTPRLDDRVVFDPSFA